MHSEHQCFTGASGRRGWEPTVLQRDQFSMRRKMVSDGKVKRPPKDKTLAKITLLWKLELWLTVVPVSVIFQYQVSTSLYLDTSWAGVTGVGKVSTTNWNVGSRALLAHRTYKKKKIKMACVAHILTKAVFFVCVFGDCWRLSTNLPVTYIIQRR